MLLDFAGSRETAPAGAGELARTMTDSNGKFAFDHLEQYGRNAGQELFAVSVHYEGYKDTFQVVDLTFTPHGYVNLELHRDTSRDIPNIPPGGPGATISGNQPATTEGRQALAKGEMLLFEKHDPNSSIEEFKKVVHREPGYGPAYMLLGTAYVQNQRWPEAQSTFEKATKLQPGNPEAYLGLGLALNAQQDFAGAQKMLLRSLQLKADSAPAQYEMAKSFWGLGKWQHAEPYARKALQIDKNFPMAHVIMGNIYLRHRDAHSALSEYQEYLRLDPSGQESGPVKDIIARIQKALGQR